VHRLQARYSLCKLVGEISVHVRVHVPDPPQTAPIRALTRAQGQHLSPPHSPRPIPAAPSGHARPPSRLFPYRGARPGAEGRVRAVLRRHARPPAGTPI